MTTISEYSFMAPWGKMVNIATNISPAILAIIINDFSDKNKEPDVEEIIEHIKAIPSTEEIFAYTLSDWKDIKKILIQQKNAHYN